MNLYSLKKNKGFSQVVDFGFVFGNASKKLKSLFSKFMLGVGLKFNKSKTFSKPKLTTGFSMAEMLVYIAVLTVILLVIVDIVLVVSKSNKQSSAYNSVKDSAIFGLEKIIKEVRLSTSIDFEQSIFNSSSSVLVLNSEDSKLIKFYLDNGLVKIDIDGEYFGRATYSGTFVSGLKFIPVDTGGSQAVKIEMNIGAETISESFYSTVVLRNSY